MASRDPARDGQPNRACRAGENRRTKPVGSAGAFGPAIGCPSRARSDDVVNRDDDEGQRELGVHPRSAHVGGC